MNNINPLLELSPQMKTAVALSDALFSGAMKPRKPSEYEMLAEAISLANRLELLLGKLLPMFADKSGNLAEAQEYAGNLMIALAGVRKELFAPYVPHEPKCGCDSCVAARSDEMFDRKRDGELCEGRQ